MRHFKKRTIALVLASVVTVVGAFGASNYKNSIMGLTFENASNGSVNMIVQTKTAYSGSLSPIRKDANTYIITLPDINSEAPTPDLSLVSGNIQSVNVRTMPYSANSNGYTRITIKTNNPSLSLNTTQQIYIPVKSETTTTKQITKEDISNVLENKNVQQVRNNEHVSRQNLQRNPRQNVNTQRINRQYQQSRAVQRQSSAPVNVQQTTNASDTVIIENPKVSTASHDFLWYVYAVLILLVIIYIFIKARQKMTEIAGESIQIDFNDGGKKKESKTKDIKKTIKKLDKSYPNRSVYPKTDEYTVSSEPVKAMKPAEELNIVDLDKLFQEQKKNQGISEDVVESSEEDSENDALEDFLSGFSFDEEFGDVEETPVEEEITVSFDEEYYQELINSENITFTQSDIECINQLLESEINDETIRNITQYAVSNPIIKKPTKEEILEELVTTYAISQNVVFSSDVMETLYKLISVEIDNDFITDLRTNPKRTEEMEAEILQGDEKLKKPSDIITLNVKDMLPDLSEALKKQGDRKIESEARPETIYYSEGYEVNKLKINDLLPDLSLEINKSSSYVSKPSAEIEYADNNYEVQTLNISQELPDLQDYLANPDKYEKPKQEEVIVDEETLLKNISNVQFKPFYDGTQQFEVLNDIPSMSDIQREFSQFDNFEIHEEEVYTKNSVQEEYDDFEALFSNEFVDLDNKDVVKDDIFEDDKELEKALEEFIEPEIEDKKIENDEVSINEPLQKKETFVPLKLERKSVEFRHRKNTTERSEELIKKIEQTKQEREKRKARLALVQEENKKIDMKQTVQSTKCIVDGENYTVISTVDLNEKVGCHLAKNENGYTVLGFCGRKIVKLMAYDSLKSEKIQARINEKISDSEFRYIIRIGLKKFLVNVSANNIEFMMNLC